jgi:predicted RNA-binding Zn-ribbon protein involved in translation (DUF1610 family)
MRDGHFMLEYAGAGAYTNPAGETIKDLMDMGCVGCGAAYYSRESSMIDFCPACGYMERKRHTTFQELQAWSNEQHWGFLSLNGHKAFGVSRDNAWLLKFAPTREDMESRGYEGIHNLLGEND